jgi:7,8-dihydropterin-6-yl-methyl-4-(beta-D-ribofuranosyl)aminobenzene 5'-phosphate synthase
MELKITFLIDNTVYLQNLKAEHGLSIMLEFSKEKILFDCGQSEAVLDNAKNLNINLMDISKIVLSHGHYDHSGGLLSVLKYINKEINIFAHPAIFGKRYVAKNSLSNIDLDSKRYIGIPDSQKTYEKHGALFNLNSSSVYLSKDIILSGWIPRKNDFEKVEDEFVKEIDINKSDNYIIHDEVDDDNAIIVNDSDGIIIISGCAHSGIINIVNRAIDLTKKQRIKAIIGGLHLSSRDDYYVNQTISGLKKYDIDLIIPAHCTGLSAMCKLKEAFNEKCVFGSVGKSLLFK